MKKLLSFAFCLAMMIVLVSCGEQEEADLWATAIYTEDTKIGEGEKTLSLEVVAEDKSVIFTINTDAETVGDALVENELISGEQGPYGIYIKAVNGITADYDKNQSYWAITKNGEYMTTGVDGAKFEDGDKFELTYTK